MHLEGIVLSEMSQAEKDKRDLTYTWHLKNKINKQTKQRKLIDGIQPGHHPMGGGGGLGEER